MYIVNFVLPTDSSFVTTVNLSNNGQGKKINGSINQKTKQGVPSPSQTPKPTPTPLAKPPRSKGYPSMATDSEVSSPLLMQQIFFEDPLPVVHSQNGMLVREVERLKGETHSQDPVGGCVVGFGKSGKSRY